MKYVCSCRILYADRKNAFEVTCKAKGHTLFEIDEMIYNFIYDLKEENSILKKRINQRNRLIDAQRLLTNQLENKLRILKA